MSVTTNFPPSVPLPTPQKRVAILHKYSVELYDWKLDRKAQNEM